jgi:hypothetical protein
MNFLTEFATVSNILTYQYSIGKSGKSIQKIILVKVSRKGLNPRDHLFKHKTPLPMIHGNPKIFRRSFSKKK